MDYAGFRSRFNADLLKEFSLELKALKFFKKIRFDEKGFKFLAVDRVYWACVFIIRELGDSPYASAILSDAFLARLKKDLAGVKLP